MAPLCVVTCLDPDDARRALHVLCQLKRSCGGRVKLALNREMKPYHEYLADLCKKYPVGISVEDEYCVCWGLLVPHEMEPVMLLPGATTYTRIGNAVTLSSWAVY